MRAICGIRTGSDGCINLGVQRVAKEGVRSDSYRRIQFLVATGVLVEASEQESRNC